jgi:hypothetical protein
MAKSVKKGSILEMASKAATPRGGVSNWFEDLRKANRSELHEVLDLMDDWASGEKQFTSSHSRASLARFLCSLDCCDRKENGMVELIRKVETGEIKTSTYR